MADAYCGPSNALQNFQKHTAVDRTLQQDRLISRRSPVQGFRSQEANAGLLDPEFEAFQASQPGPLPFAEPHPAQLQPSLVQRGKQPAFGGPVDWAADFQRLHVSPSPHQQQFSHPPPQSLASAPPQISQASQAGPAFAQNAYAPQFSGQGFYSSFSGGFQGYNGGYMQQNGPQQVPAAASSQLDQFDEEAFARAFDAAQEEILAQETAASQVSQQMSAETFAQQDTLMETMDQTEIPALSTDADILRTAPTEQVMEQKSSEQQAADDNDDLARTASELLDRVQDNQSEKFQNSSFLELMRRLRDREVKVEGDKMVETGSSMPAEASQNGRAFTSGTPAQMHADQPSPQTVPEQSLRDGEEVVRLLDEPSTLDQDPEYMMTSPFYDNQHAALGRQGLWQEYEEA